MSAAERDERLRRAERARQAGRLDLAIAELDAWLAVSPDDVNVANALGDLYVGAGQPAPALPLFLRVGDYYYREGFYSKATAVYRKILKFVPRDESMILRLAESLAAQGLTVEARTQFVAVESARRHRGDIRGAEDVALRLSDLEPSDLKIRWAAARALAQRGDAAAAARYEDLAQELERQGRVADALAVWHEVIALDPADIDRRERAARRAWANGDTVAARIFLALDDMPPRESSLALLLEMELTGGTADGIRAAASRWLDAFRASHTAIVQMAIQRGRLDPERAWACIAVPVERALATARAGDAEFALRQFAAAGVVHGAALARWIEVSVLARVDSSAPLVRAALAALPVDGPSGARQVVEAAARRVAPHGPWVDLFSDVLGYTVTAQPEPLKTAQIIPFVPPPPAQVPDASPVSEPPSRNQAAESGEYIEVDLTPALNALALGGDEEAMPLEADVPPPATGYAQRPAPTADEARAALARGQAFLAAGMADDARASLERALEGPETAQHAALALAELYDQDARPADACAVLEHVLPSAQGREQAYLLAQLVVCLEHAGRPADALARLGELARVMPLHPVVRARRGREGSPGR